MGTRSGEMNTMRIEHHFASDSASLIALFANIFTERLLSPEFPA